MRLGCTSDVLSHRYSLRFHFQCSGCLDTAPVSCHAQEGDRVRVFTRSLTKRPSIVPGAATADGTVALRRFVFGSLLPQYLLGEDVACHPTRDALRQLCLQLVERVQWTLLSASPDIGEAQADLALVLPALLGGVGSTEHSPESHYSTLDCLGRLLKTYRETMFNARARMDSSAATDWAPWVGCATATRVFIPTAVQVHHELCRADTWLTPSSSWPPSLRSVHGAQFPPLLEYLAVECLRNLLDLRRAIATPSPRALALVPDARRVQQLRHALWAMLPDGGGQTGTVGGNGGDPLVLRELCRHLKPRATRPLMSYELYPFNTLLAIFRLSTTGREVVLAMLPTLHEVIRGGCSLQPHCCAAYVATVVVQPTGPIWFALSVLCCRQVPDPYYHRSPARTRYTAASAGGLPPNLQHGRPGPLQHMYGVFLASIGTAGEAYTAQLQGLPAHASSV